jgi:hypothetical protein
MTRVLHVGNFPTSARDCFLHNTTVKLNNGLTRNGHSVIAFSDRAVARASGWFGHRRWGRRGVNAALLALCREARPGLLLLTHADMIDNATISAIREQLPLLRVIQINVDPLFEPNNVARIEARMPVVDASLITTAGPQLAALAQPGRVVGFLPNAVDWSIETGEAHLHDRLAHDFFYACGNPARPLRVVCGRAWNMDDFIGKLLDAVPGARPLLAGLGGEPHLRAAGYQAALETVAIGLNISRRADSHLYSSDRLAQMAGNGLAVLMERACGYDTLFGDDEMGFFSSFEELAEMLARLIAEPARRRAMAEAGRARYHALFNERIVAGYVHDVAFGRHDPAGYEWPTLAG